MSQIKQLIRLYQAGQPIKSIARTLGISKNTVKSYLSKIAVADFKPSELLQLEDPVLEGKLHAGNPAFKDERFENFQSNLPYLYTELKRVGVTKKLLWEEYIQVFTKGYCYSQFCAHLYQQQLAKKVTSVLTFQPGEKLCIDFAG